MTHLKFIAILLIFTFPACGQSTSRAPAKNSNTQQSYPSYIIFGIFCGECSGHCATMYRYNMMGNTNTLLVDSTDSYFKNDGKVVCKTQLTDITKFQTVNKLVQRIPQIFLKTNTTEQTFGCPDCTDGCGIYFEVEQDTVVKKFYIDYTTDKLDKEVRDFGEIIKATLLHLINKN